MREPIKQRAAAFRQLQVDTEPKHLQTVLEFADRAYRRPLTPAETDELRGLYRKLREQELPHDEAIRLTLARVLVAPAFLYRAEKPRPGTEPGPVNDWELATRLSYFLWSSAPDCGTARSGGVRKAPRCQCARDTDKANARATRACGGWRPSSAAPGCTFTASTN